jgi:hypothetical protein
MGVTLALPLLDSMLPAQTPLAKTAAKAPNRYAFLHVPHGASMGHWTPKTEGADFELTPILSPLEPFREQLIVISDMEHAMANSLTPDEAAGDHSRTTAVFLSGAHPKRTEGQDVRAGITIDQVLAKKIGQDTSLPSIELGIEDYGALGVCGFGYSCVYSNMVSWSTPNTPLPAVTDPVLVFERLFGDGASAEERAARKREDRSILDSVTRDIARLRAGLGPGDRNRLNQYLDDVREIERRIQIAEKNAAVDIDRPTPEKLPFDQHVKLMLDLLALAFKADITRISTMMFSRDASDRLYPESGVPDAYHALSHHGNDPVKLERYARINKYHVSIVAYFLDKLKSTEDGDGALLDHSMVLFGSPMSNSNLHDHGPLPVFMVGSASGLYKGNRHMRNPAHTDM